MYFVLDQDEKSESGHDSTNEDNESDDSNYVDESLSTEEKKETNPFSLFEYVSYQLRRKWIWSIS